jgi:hypothetical protein
MRGRVDNSDGYIFISPLQLERLAVSWKSLRDKSNLISVEYGGRIYNSPQIEFLDELYNTCLLIKIQLQSNIESYGEAQITS